MIILSLSENHSSHFIRLSCKAKPKGKSSLKDKPISKVYEAPQTTTAQSAKTTKSQKTHLKFAI